MIGSRWLPVLSAEVHVGGQEPASVRFGALARWSYLIIGHAPGQSLVPMYYDRNGERISLEQWSQLFSDNRYKRIAATTVHHRYWISTIWLGLDHNYWPDGLPMVYETCIFDHDDLTETDLRSRPFAESYVIRRYPTEDSARRGHRQIVKLIRKGVKPQDIE